MTKYYFVRHGQSESNASGVLAGWLDFPLTDNGVQQAIETADNIKRSGVKFDSILSSPLSRAYRTAGIIAETNGYTKEDIQIIDDLKGGGGGDLEGLPYKHWYATPEEEIAELHGGEDAEILRRRIGKVITRITELTSEDDSTLIVAHAAVYQMIKAIYDKIEPATEAYKIANIKHGEFIEIDL